ncbi:MAG TPA: DUF2293 domain-containing protein [Kribbellaceae bacterium]|nr:DUF2293 domain-containing protein [Kribbellaceae bacterium]
MPFAEKPDSFHVVEPLRGFTCAGCGRDDDPYLRLENDEPYCMACSDLDHLVFLASGNTALTRRARKASTLSAIVIRWNSRHKRYERQGTLVEQAALETAEEQCLADADVRARRRERAEVRRAAEDLDVQARLAAEIRRLFPSCPAGRAEAIARHAGTRSSGRVGRTAAGRALDSDAVTAAVVASIRHEDTPYDELLMAGIPRDEARAQVRTAIDGILATWRA